MSVSNLSKVSFNQAALQLKKELFQSTVDGCIDPGIFKKAINFFSSGDSAGGQKILPILSNINTLLERLENQEENVIYVNKIFSNFDKVYRSIEENLL